MWELDTLRHLWPWISPCQSRCISQHLWPCATAAGPLKGLWPKGKSMLEKAHLKTPVAVLEVMLEYSKVCGCG